MEDTQKDLHSPANTSGAARLSPASNYGPSSLEHIHLMGICGTGMASLAGLLKEKGYRVTGSDQDIYPPMSDFLRALRIPIRMGYHGGNLHPVPDLVIVGNVITRMNPEAVELSHLRVPYLSFPQALNHFAMKGKQSIVVSGTHGKTTTTALAAWILECAGLDPGFMIGGIPINFKKNFKTGEGGYFVIEGDEYDTAFFDKGPKFLHYRPRIVILTSIEFDHADIYRDLEHVLSSFRRLIDLIPPEGLLIANADDPRVVPELRRARCPIRTYGLSGSPGWKAVHIRAHDDMTRLTIEKEGAPFLDLETRLYGRHNMANLLSTVVLADFLGVSHKDLAMAVGSFCSVKRRQEILGEQQGVLVLDDFAHHPTAVLETIHAVKERFPERRLVAVFEPRSNSSRRSIFQERYAGAFERADRVMIPEPPLMERVPDGERFSADRLAKDLQKKGVAASYFDTHVRLLENLVLEARSGDVTLFMSNGGFDNLPERFLKGLGQKAPPCDADR
ncbi:MAG: UDP-N-acetylmuramate:L-alanyl-gamma-D-glutamyl-meso-diaminopimelate ligase [Desulfatiglandaceae bacterium]|jgi:UDP-N-acetylmuramate: L-alanyl-gamma-D-glutamyl-meso-diaminopimelate ligase